MASKTRARRWPLVYCVCRNRRRCTCGYQKLLKQVYHLKGGNPFLDNMSNAGSRMWEWIQDGKNDLLDTVNVDVPNRLNDGVNYATRYSTKIGMGGPMSSLRDGIDVFTGVNKSIANHDDLDVFSHPQMK